MIGGLGDILVGFVGISTVVKMFDSFGWWPSENVRPEPSGSGCMRAAPIDAASYLLMLEAAG